MSETLLQHKMMVHARRNNVFCEKMRIEAKKGFPDLLLLFPDGTFVLIEVKNPNGKGCLSASQKRMIAKLRDKRANVYVVDNYEEYLRIYEKFIGEN